MNRDARLLWKKFLLEQKDKVIYIKNEELFMKYNTYLLTPEVSLRSYLGLERQEAAEGIFRNLLQSVDLDINTLFSEMRTILGSSNCISGLMNNVQVLDFIVRMYASYESLARLIYIIESVKDLEKLRRDLGLLEEFRLPSGNYEKSIRQRIELRQVFTIILCALLQGRLSSLIEELSEVDRLYMSISQEIKELENRIRGVFLLLDLYSNMPEHLKSLFEDLILYLYGVSKRGAKKAVSGLNYESILIEYLSSQIDIEGLVFRPSGRYQNKSVDGYITYRGRKIGIFESTYLITTSSDQTNKVDRILDNNRLRSLEEDMIVLIILLDGAGWLARISDARKFIDSAIRFPHVWTFTYHKESLSSLIGLIKDLTVFFEKLV